MNDIDWSNAPEGATHYQPQQQAFYADMGGEKWMIWARNLSGLLCWQPSTGTVRDCLIPAPSEAAWTGEGLPPVGTVCEAWHNGSAQGVVEVRYAGNCMVLWNVKLKHEQCSVAENYYFRPIRTPEQIAAYEREEAIEALAVKLAGHWSSEAVSLQRETAAYLHDIGYRRVEQ
ncbi:hypothetical protein MT1_3769 [Pseudomonas sp. MT-1]|uniref:hypothetical protein n=1 Tax=Stutzerimonas stutzeri TaxID=316 RepID=UPI000535C18E|nr:hypothetical protein [Stutzerimonas stutzeri]MCQ4282593.1 hypothetical protein [Stutzerimonas stutzeri]BAP80944.1 hypothetical protein MT1_3769 [Pseudomonas sp. MT-1]